jgi:hypothetical protein
MSDATEYARCPECDSTLYAGVCYSRGCPFEGVSDPYVGWPNPRAASASEAPQ